MLLPIARTTWWMLLAGVCRTAAGWTYNEDEWPTECKEGTKQSPIALSPGIAQMGEFSSLIFERYDVTYPVLSKNNGHSVEVQLQVDNKPQVKGGGLPHVYILDNVHFHWDSEHTMDDQRFPLEMHLVHYASSFHNVSEALKHTGGVTVFSVLFYLSPDNDVSFEPLTSSIYKIQDLVNAVEEMRIKLDDLLPRDRAGFYRYNGSLTTPGCTEGVIWTVFTNKLPISRSQINSFPLIKSDHHEPLVKNYRSLQKLNGRRVLLRQSPIGGASGSASFVLGSICKISLIALFLKSVMSV